jgi:hypothetical protein
MTDRALPIGDAVSRRQVELLLKNAADFGIELSVSTPRTRASCTSSARSSG